MSNDGQAPIGRGGVTGYAVVSLGSLNGASIRGRPIKTSATLLDTVQSASEGFSPNPWFLTGQAIAPLSTGGC